MNAGKRQVIAELIASTVRVLELLEFHDYEIGPPKNQRGKGNASPRVVRVNIGQEFPLRIYNSGTGSTWANMPDGTPVQGITCIEDIYSFLKKRRTDEERTRGKKASLRAKKKVSR